MTVPSVWPAPPALPPPRPSADDDPAWVWIVNLVLALVLLAGAVVVLALSFWSGSTRGSPTPRMAGPGGRSCGTWD